MAKERRAKKGPRRSAAAPAFHAALLSAALVLDGIGAASFVLLAQGAARDVAGTWALALAPLLFVALLRKRGPSRCPMRMALESHPLASLS